MRHVAARQERQVPGWWSPWWENGPQEEGRGPSFGGDGMYMRLGSSADCGHDDLSSAHADEPPGSLWAPPTWRVGEAANPGPLAAFPTARRALARRDQAAVQYPQAGKGCLKYCVSPGHRAEGQDSDGGETFKLKIETVNSTGWSALKWRILTTDAHVICAQETWVNQAAVAGASAWARRNGWRSVWSPAATTKRGGTAGGVAILARDHMGLHLPPNDAHEVVPARAVMAVLEAPGQRAIRVLSCYLKHGVKATEENASTLALVGEVVQRCGDDEPCVVGGDFNMAPQRPPGHGAG